MESTIMEPGKDNKREELPKQSSVEKIEPVEENLASSKSASKLETHQTLILNTRRSRKSGSCSEKSFLEKFHGLHGKIPKHIVSFDEKYVLRCLELMHSYAWRAAAFNFPSNVDILSSSLSNLTEIKDRGSYDIDRLLTQSHSAAQMESIMVDSNGDWIIGSITGSKSMINLLKSPLLRQFGSLDGHVNNGTTSLLDISGPACLLTNSPGGLGFSLANKQQKNKTFRDSRDESESVHKRAVSMSSMTSTSSDQSSSSASATFLQGVLQCTWKDGMPHHVLSIDDKKEVYVAYLSELESPSDKVLDYVYTFHSRKPGTNRSDLFEPESELVGKMQVSTSITLCPNNSEIMETRFVLFGSSDSNMQEMHDSSHYLKKNKKLARKVVEVFRSSHSHKQRSFSKFGGTSVIPEDCSWDPSQDVKFINRNLVQAGLENQYVPNLELAAIVVKDHTCNNYKQTKIGGWGLKFLKKNGSNAPPETSILSKCCSELDGECSTSTNIILPAGFHGGPRTRIGGPSSLIDRWLSGGHCDCGGWDIGCSLTVLNTRSSSTQGDDSGECKSFDIFIQGSKQNVPVMKMVNIRDNLYYIYFQTTMSSVQLFATAAAIIHSRSPLLHSKMYRS